MVRHKDIFTVMRFRNPISHFSAKMFGEIFEKFNLLIENFIQFVIEFVGNR